MLHGCVCYVDVHIEGGEGSTTDRIQKELKAMGAK